MRTNFPTIGQYNKHFNQNGNNDFQTLRNIILVPSRTLPIKLYLFGSGAYAAVFKGTLQGKVYAIRCFLGSAQDTIPRYEMIAKYLKNINSLWKVDFEFLDRELFIENTSYPVLKMEWVEGQLINDFIDQNLDNNKVLNEIQKKLVDISRDLEDNEIAHGDLQFGNIMVTGNSGSFEIRLIDYDGMYVPEMSGWEAIEIGRSEFQHPTRNKKYFNSRIDRFSFWVMLTGLEAIKHDKSLWKQVMQGGYNTLDNCLFTIQDFLNPNQSELFQRLSRIENADLDFYAGRLISFCLGDINSVSIPVLFNEKQKAPSNLENSQAEIIINNSSNFLSSSRDFKIECGSGKATVLSSSFVKIGQTPILLEKREYVGKTIIVTNGFETKQVVLFDRQLAYNVQLSSRTEEKKNLVTK